MVVCLFLIVSIPVSNAADESKMSSKKAFEETKRDLKKASEKIEKMSLWHFVWMDGSLSVLLSFFLSHLIYGGLNGSIPPPPQSLPSRLRLCSSL